MEVDMDKDNTFPEEYDNDSDIGKKIAGVVIPLVSVLLLFAVLGGVYYMMNKDAFSSSKKTSGRAAYDPDDDDDDDDRDDDDDDDDDGDSNASLIRPEESELNAALAAAGAGTGSPGGAAGRGRECRGTDSDRRAAAGNLEGKHSAAGSESNESRGNLY